MIMPKNSLAMIRRRWLEWVNERQTELEVWHFQSAALGVVGAGQSVACPRTPATPFEDSRRATRPATRPSTDVVQCKQD